MSPRAPSDSVVQCFIADAERLGNGLLALTIGDAGAGLNDDTFGENRHSARLAPREAFGVNASAILVAASQPLRIHPSRTTVTPGRPAHSDRVGNIVSGASGPQVIRTATWRIGANVVPDNEVTRNGTIRQLVSDAVRTVVSPGTVKEISGDLTVAAWGSRSHPCPAVIGLINGAPKTPHQRAALKSLTARPRTILSATLPYLSRPCHEGCVAASADARNLARLLRHRSYPFGEARAVATVPGHSCVNYTTWSAIYIDRGAVAPAPPAPVPTPVPQPTRAHVLMQEIRERLDELANLVA